MQLPVYHEYAWWSLAHSQGDHKFEGVSMRTEVVIIVGKCLLNLLGYFSLHTKEYFRPTKKKMLPKAKAVTMYHDTIKQSPYTKLHDRPDKLPLNHLIT